jgi:hypothetical protein
VAPFLAVKPRRQRIGPRRARHVACVDGGGCGAGGVTPVFAPLRRLRFGGHVPGRPRTGTVWPLPTNGERLSSSINTSFS